jgi:hypothetical protein
VYSHIWTSREWTADAELHGRLRDFDQFRLRSAIGRKARELLPEFVVVCVWR